VCWIHPLIAFSVLAAALADATKKAITTRFYHNGAFLAAVVRSFFLVRTADPLRGTPAPSLLLPCSLSY
jgi:hypothetical protein